MAKTNLTAARLRELLDYNPETGVFLKRFLRGVLKQTGVKNSHGYSVIKIDRKSYGAHRLAWLYAHGTFPACDVDHINGDRSDNRIVNLRAVTRGENTQNQRIARTNNKSGFLGVCSLAGKWQAQIKIDGKAMYLGLFDTPEAAHTAYIAAKRQLHSTCTI